MMRNIKTAKQKPAILVFYPHYKAIGFAVMDSSSSISKSGYRYILAKKEADRYIHFMVSLIKFYNPTLIILEDEQSRNQHRGSDVLSIFKEVERIIGTMRCPIQHYLRKDIVDHFGGDTKEQIAQHISEIFTDYRTRLPKKRATFDGAESPALCEFDAISFGLTHFSQLETKTP